MMKLETLCFDFVKELSAFSYELSVRDRIWDILFPDQSGKWRYINVNKYNSVFYITEIDGTGKCLEVKLNKEVRAIDPGGNSFTFSRNEEDYRAETWNPLIEAVRNWLKIVRKDWIKAAKRVQAEYPLNFRYGTVPHAFIRASFSDFYRLDKEVGRAGTREMIRLVEQGFFLKDSNLEAPSMTAGDYFRYCKLAYIAGKKKGETLDSSLSGREMYKRYADGRHEGLLDISLTSKQEFAAWIDHTHPKRTTGGHPWEIKRGGNTTHIDLSVFRPSTYRKEGFKVELRGEALGRMAETILMFLAIHRAGLPISIANPEKVRKRLLAQDNIGLIPAYVSPHRANQHFSEDKDVFEVLHYDDLGRFKSRITPFVVWEKLPVAIPCNCP